MIEILKFLFAIVSVVKQGVDCIGQHESGAGGNGRPNRCTAGSHGAHTLASLLYCCPLLESVRVHSQARR